MEAILGISQTSVNDCSTIVNSAWCQGIVIPAGMKNICKIDLYAMGGPNVADMAIGIKDSLTGPDLYNQAVHFGGEGWNEFWLNDVFTVTPGKTYYINLQRPGASYMSWGKNVFGNPYAPEMSYIGTSGHPNNDFAFKVYYTEPVIKQSISVLGNGIGSMGQIATRFKNISVASFGTVGVITIRFYQLVLSKGLYTIVKLDTFAKLFSSARKKIYEVTQGAREFFLKSKS